jgi:predicted O-methyltransferase YrrM
MKNQESTIVFDRERASKHDQQFARLAPIQDELNLSMCMVLSELPNDARILCVGVGTGGELIPLAQHFPHWQFTAVEPAAPMLEICRQKVEEYGIASRCTFHKGYLDSLPASDAFDAAKSAVLLISGVGGLMIMGLGLNLIEIMQISVASFLPALIVASLLCTILQQFSRSQ